MPSLQKFQVRPSAMVATLIALLYIAVFALPVWKAKFNTHATHESGFEMETSTRLRWMNLTTTTSAMGSSETKTRDYDKDKEKNIKQGLDVTLALIILSFFALLGYIGVSFLDRPRLRKSGAALCLALMVTALVYFSVNHPKAIKKDTGGNGCVGKVNICNRVMGSSREVVFPETDQEIVSTQEWGYDSGLMVAIGISVFLFGLGVYEMVR
jgi:uncharacterized membrane protein YqjE